MKLVDTTQQIEIMIQHPCFNDMAHDHVGRVHLPVAPRCNIQCNFCERNTCATMAIQHPGWTARLLSVSEAVNFVRSIMCSSDVVSPFVLGIAGPGDPLANAQTFDTLGLIHKEYPHLLKCMSTNGLLLEDKLAEVVNAGIRATTVTINAVDSQIGKEIYSWVSYHGNVYRGKEAAGLLIAKQFSGIRKAVDAGLTIKVNTVLIPGINDGQMLEIARLIKKAGVKMMNIMPLIPMGRMRNRLGPTCDELRMKRIECERIIPQFRRCEQCRADIVYLP